MARRRSSLSVYVPVAIVRISDYSTCKDKKTDRAAGVDKVFPCAHIPSPTCNGHPPSGCLIVLFVSTTGTAIPFAAPAA